MRPTILHGHSRPLTYVHLNADGDLLFTTSKDGGVCLWRTKDGQRIGTYLMDKPTIWNCDTTLDSQLLACASSDSKVHIFETFTGKELFKIKEAGPCKFVEWNRKPGHQNRLVVQHDSFGSQARRSIKVWSIEDGEPRRLWIQDDYASRCNNVHWGPYDETIISCHESGDIIIWDAETGEYISEFKAHKSTITCMSLTEDRMLALTCSADGSAALWDTVNWEKLKSYKTDRPLNACGISPLYNNKNGLVRRHVLLGGGQSAEDVTTTVSSEGRFQALLHHMVHEEELGSMKGHFGPLNSLCWFPDGGGFVSGGEEGFVRMYRFDAEYFTDKFD